MIMVIGGAFQGQLEYARTLEECENISWIDGRNADREELLNCQGVYDFHEFIKKSLKAGEDCSSLAEELWEKNPQIAIVSDEIGYGVVPIDAFERQYRELVGRVCTKLASHSKKVCRVVCGIGTVIKDD